MNLTPEHTAAYVARVLIRMEILAKRCAWWVALSERFLPVSAGIATLALCALLIDHHGLYLLSVALCVLHLVAGLVMYLMVNFYLGRLRAIRAHIEALEESTRDDPPVR